MNALADKVHKQGKSHSGTALLCCINFRRLQYSYTTELEVCGDSQIEKYDSTSIVNIVYG